MFRIIEKKMRKLYILIFFLLLVGCSFDNKTGIWDGGEVVKKSKSAKKDIRNLKKNRKLSCLFIKTEKCLEEKNLEGLQYEDVFTEDKLFNSEVIVDLDYRFSINDPVKNTNTLEEFNNLVNFDYINNKDIISKGKKLKTNIFSKILNYNNMVISHDHKGIISLYSIEEKRKIWEFDFYKKKFKKYKKKVYLAIDDNTVFAADNLGYLYALDLKNKKLIWAKNFGIPFRSNLKIQENQIFLANQDNTIYSINKKTGNVIWQYATSPTKLKNVFKNNIATDVLSSNLFFLNTSGEMYSINYLSQRINWVINFKRSTLGFEEDLFFGQPLVIKDSTVIISASNTLLNYDAVSGSRYFKIPLSVVLKPIVTSNNIFLLTKSNFLICLDKKSGNVIWSKKIKNQFTSKKHLKLSKKMGSLIDMTIAKNEIFIVSKNGYLLTFNYKNGSLNYFDKISRSGFSSRMTFSNGYMYILDKNKRLIKYN